MSATAQQLLENLYAIVNTDPESVPVLSLEHASGNVQWRVAEHRLHITAPELLEVDLSAHTIASLADHFRAQPGFSVPWVGIEYAGLGARCLLDGAGAVGILHAPQSLLWALLRGYADELDAASAEIATMLAQMSVKTASGEWLDHLCRNYYNIPREAGEGDHAYRERTIAEVLMPRGNNIAIASALSRVIPQFDFRITDAPMTIKGGSLGAKHDAYYRYDAHATRGSADIGGIKGYNEFDARIDVDLLLFDFTPAMIGLVRQVRAVVERFRDAGTRLREVNFHGGLSDSLDTAEDGAIAMQATPELQDRYFRGGHLHDGKPRRCATTGIYYDAQHQHNASLPRTGYLRGAGCIRYDTDLDPLRLDFGIGHSDEFGRPYLHDGTMMRAAFTRYNGFIPRTADMLVAMPKPWRYNARLRRDGTGDRTGYRQRFIERLFLHIQRGGVTEFEDEVHDFDLRDPLPISPEHAFTEVLEARDAGAQSHIQLAPLSDTLGRRWTYRGMAGRTGAATRGGWITQQQIMATPMAWRDWSGNDVSAVRHYYHGTDSLSLNIYRGGVLQGGAEPVPDYSSTNAPQAFFNVPVTLDDTAPQVSDTWSATLAEYVRNQGELVTEQGTGVYINRSL